MRGVFLKSCDYVESSLFESEAHSAGAGEQVDRDWALARCSMFLP